MISLNKLKKISIDYQLSFSEKEINFISENGNDEEVEKIIRFVLETLHYSPSSIEKCPNILCCSLSILKENVQCLQKYNLDIDSLETSLPIFLTPPEQLKETYQYIRDNYENGIITLIPSILGVKRERIIEIEEYFSHQLSPQNILYASVSNHDVHEIEEILEICSLRKIPIDGIMFTQDAKKIAKIETILRRRKVPYTPISFIRTPEEVNQLIDLCEQIHMEVSPFIFYRTPKEFLEIIEICKKHQITIISEFFQRTPKELSEIIKYCEDKKIPLIGAMASCTKKEIATIHELCEQNRIKCYDSMFERTPKEIRDIIQIAKTHNIAISSHLFHKPPQKVADAIDVCEALQLEPNGYVLQSTPSEISKITKIYQNILGTKPDGSAFTQLSDEVEKIIKLCQKYHIPINGILYLKQAEDLEKTIQYIIDNFGEEYLLPSIIIYDKDHVQKVFSYLRGKGLLEIIKNDQGILKLTFKELIEREACIKWIGEELIEGDHFNPIFNLSINEFENLKSKIIKKGKKVLK